MLRVFPKIGIRYYTEMGLSRGVFIDKTPQVTLT